MILSMGIYFNLGGLHYGTVYNLSWLDLGAIFSWPTWSSTRRSTSSGRFRNACHLPSPLSNIRSIPTTKHWCSITSSHYGRYMGLKIQIYNHTKARQLKFGIWSNTFGTFALLSTGQVPGLAAGTQLIEGSRILGAVPKCILWFRQLLLLSPHLFPSLFPFFFYFPLFFYFIPLSIISCNLNENSI